MNTVRITVYWNNPEGVFDKTLRGILCVNDIYAECDDFELGEEVELREKSFVFRGKEFPFFDREPNGTDIEGDDLQMKFDDVVAFYRMALENECFAVIDFTEGGLIWNAITD